MNFDKLKLNLLNSTADVGLKLININMIVLDRAMRKILMIKGLNPDSIPRQFLIEKLTTIHEKDYDDDFDFSDLKKELPILPWNVWSKEKINEIRSLFKSINLRAKVFKQDYSNHLNQNIS